MLPSENVTTVLPSASGSVFSTVIDLPSCAFGIVTFVPSLNVTSVLPSGVCVEPVIVNGFASAPF